MHAKVPLTVASCMPTKEWKRHRVTGPVLTKQTLQEPHVDLSGSAWRGSS